MKRFICILIALMMVFSLAACGDSEPAAEDGQDNGGVVAPDETDSGSKKASKGDVTLEELLAHEPSPEADFNCATDVDGGLMITGYVGNDEIVVIPETIGGTEVTAIDEMAFSKLENLKAIKTADSIRIIEDMAFILCENLQIVVLGSGTESIGVSSLQECRSLEQVILNDGLKEIGDLAFSTDLSLKSVEIPVSVETIGVAIGYGIDGFTLIGAAGSYAETRAAECGYNFQAK